jgi:hypothetical protein
MTALYLRDYIDAIHAFFRNEYDDCIRRIITATENFIDARNWKVKRSCQRTILDSFVGLLRLSKKNGYSFRRRLADNLDLNAISGRVISENLEFVFNVRNRIVHRGFRMSTDCGMFCDKAVCSLYYLIYRYSGDRAISRYAYTLHQQFTHQKRFLGDLYDLDEVKHRLAVPSPDVKPIDSHEAFEEFIFESLRVSQRDKRSI